MKWLISVTAIFIAAFSMPASGESARRIKWSDLVPPIEKYEDPFLSLSSEQKLDLSVVAVVQQIKARSETLDPAQQAKRDEAMARLKKNKIDVDGLLARRAEITEKRRQAGESVNDKLNGQQVRMPGYVLPLESDGRKVTEFLLVPYVGACIHAPTPPANQIVHVKHAKGFEAAGLFAPVWVEGLIRTERSMPQLSFIDGSAGIQTAYALDAAAIKPYSQ